MTLASGIYEGWVRHTRERPVARTFTFPLFMMLLDLGELDEVFSISRLYSMRRPAPARLKRSEYLGNENTPLAEAVRERVREATGNAPAGPIRVLTHLRYFGYVFNPVSFYYCMDRTGDRVEQIVAEITNTPWKERHAYVLDARREGKRRFTFAKQFHVSPFMPMGLRYDWRFSEPGRRLGVHMRLDDDEGELFSATLALTRHELSPASMRRVLWRYPLMTTRVIAKIHFEALKLWLRRVPVHPHPTKRETPVAGEVSHR